MTLAGIVDSKQIKLLKIPEDFKFDPVYWYAIKAEDPKGLFAGRFTFIPYLNDRRHLICSAIEQSFDNLSAGVQSIDSIT